MCRVHDCVIRVKWFVLIVSCPLLIMMRFGIRKIQLLLLLVVTSFAASISLHVDVLEHIFRKMRDCSSCYEVVLRLSVLY